MILQIISNEDGKQKTTTLNNVNYYCVSSDTDSSVLSVGFTYGTKEPCTIISHAGENKFNIVVDKLRQRGLPMPKNCNK